MSWYQLIIIFYHILGTLLDDVTYIHPISKNRECPLLSASHVTMDKGTGLVHTAPNHGLDDYIVIKKQQIPLDVRIKCLIFFNFSNFNTVPLNVRIVIF